MHNNCTYVFLELASQELDQSIVEIFASKECVSIGGFDLKDALLDFKNGNVKSATTQVVNSNTKIRKIRSDFIQIKKIMHYILSSVLSMP
jgi:hypothetical protein